MYIGEHLTDRLTAMTTFSRLHEATHLLLLHVIPVRCHATNPQSYLFQSGNHCCKSIHRDVAVSPSRRGGSRTSMPDKAQRDNPSQCGDFITVMCS
ncbi:hypothetical protein P692DRAFT_20930417 [Suillus brevipes Sb2]|nr:hypothetical protein P692DRAFT_20930417 [Suillus brevipes Sb2]